jgi:hypothetical protein
MWCHITEQLVPLASKALCSFWTSQKPIIQLPGVTTQKNWVLRFPSAKHSRRTDSEFPFLLFPIMMSSDVSSFKCQRDNQWYFNKPFKKKKGTEYHSVISQTVDHKFKKYCKKQKSFSTTCLTTKKAVTFH